MSRAVFLDRDGVLNRALVRGGRPYAPHRLPDFEILPGVHDALIALRRAGFLNVVVTNQPDVAEGLMTMDTLEEMHRRLRLELAVDDIKVCLHTEGVGCPCRKPKPGMLLEAAQEFGIELGNSYMIGDRWRDTGAGQAAGCASLFIDYGYLEQRPVPPYVAATSLADAARWILDASAPTTKD